jgi:hypothetical protein
VSLDAERLAQGRRWLRDWQEAGAWLEHERWTHVRALDDDSAWDEAQALFALWEPGWEGDAGEGLLLQRDVFARAAKRLDR